MKQEKEKAPSTAATMQSAKNKIQHQNTADQTICQALEIPGCCFVGYIINEQTDGKAVPLYEPKQPTDGQSSINTLKGWNLLRWKSGERQLKKRTGRNPTNEEIQAELDQQAAEAQRMVAQLEMNQSETLPQLFR